MSEVCTDNRFELIEKYKAKLIEATNIEDDRDEMAVIDNILFRFWQMGWLDRLEKPERKTGKWEKTITYYPYCSICEWMPEEDEMTHGLYNYCPNCGARLED